MQLDSKINIHNRFDFEKNGKIVAYAENIILDKMYTRLCNLSSYFNNIHFGSGSGTPVANRTTLFNHVGTRTAVTVETIQDFPISKWVRKITLAPEDYIDTTFTEVGIAFGGGSSDLVTHAMIQDAEGNPLSIIKTELDVIVIYATVFITFEEEEGLKWHRPAATNNIVQYLTAHGGVSNNIYTGSIKHNNSASLLNWLATKVATRTVDIPNKKVIFNPVRFGISESNAQITQVALFNSLIANSGNIQPLAPTNIVGQELGVGDGVQKSYLIPLYNFEDLDIRVNGVIVSNYIIDSSIKTFNISYPVYSSSTYNATAMSPNGKYIVFFTGKYIASNTTAAAVYYKNDNNMIECIGEVTGYWLPAFVIDGDETYLKIERNNGGNVYFKLSPTSVGPEVPNPGGSHVKVNSFEEYACTSPPGGIVYTPTVKTGITFETAPALNDVITADYKIVDIPKSSDYVLDISFTVKFGEGI